MQIIKPKLFSVTMCVYGAYFSVGTRRAVVGCLNLLIDTSVMHQGFGKYLLPLDSSIHMYVTN